MLPSPQGTSAQPGGEQRTGPVRIGICLFSLSFATVLFTLAVFKLLSFFIMPSLFFDLLFIGFPLGAFLGVRFFPVSYRSFLRSLWLLQGIMAASVAVCLLGKHFDYLRAHLFDVEVPKLILQMGIFTALYIPFFVAYGLSEYLGYQLGLRYLGGRMPLVYALYLFGAATAYLLVREALAVLGMVRVLTIPFLAVALAIFTLQEGRRRLAVVLNLVLLAGVLLWPGIEQTFLALYKAHGGSTTWEYHRLGCRTVFQKWGRYSLVEILQSPDGTNFYGFYNDRHQWEYDPRYGFHEPWIGMAPILATPSGSRIAIVGAGGGRQVRFAQLLGHRQVVAIELEPAVMEAVRSPAHLLHLFDHVYDQPGVTPVTGDARTYFEKSQEKFDLIYLPSVGGYPQMMLEPGNMIRTYEAYRTMRDRLTDRGILAIWYPLGLDPKGILTDQYVRTFRKLELRTEAFVNKVEFLILGYRDPNAKLHTPQALMEDYMPRGHIDPEALNAIVPRAHEVANDPLFTPIPDDRPFLGGNVRYVLSIGQVCELFGFAGAVLVVAGLAVFIGFRKRGDPGIAGRSYRATAGLALLLGANFLVIEHYLVLLLFRRLYVYGDALMLGAVGFLLLSGLGSFLATWRFRPALTGAATAAMVVLLTIPEKMLPASGVLLLIVPVALATGSFFPALFEAAARNPLAVFALDGIGAGLGALLAAFLPILFGFKAFFVSAGILFLLTGAASSLFHYVPQPGPSATAGS